MARGSEKVLDRLFRALASQPRRHILRLAAQEMCAVTELAALLKMSEPTVSKHVRVLVDAGLLSKTRDGRYRWCLAKRSAFERILAFIEVLCGLTPHLLDMERRRTIGNRDQPTALQLKNMSGAVALKRLEHRRATSEENLDERPKR